MSYWKELLLPLEDNLVTLQNSPSRQERNRAEDAIAVTGLGCCSAAGQDVPAVRQSVDRTIARCRTGRADLFIPCPVAPVFMIEGQDFLAPARKSLDRLPVHLETLNRTAALAMAAIAEALRQAGLDDPANLRGKKVGIALGTTVGCTFLNEGYYKNWKDGHPQDDGPIFDYLSSNLAELVQRILQVAGPRVVITNACASGTDAIGLALGWLRGGLCDIAIAGGADGLSRVACHGFNSLMLVSKNPCRPFDATRDGLNLGEGAGILVMEREASARARLASISGWVRGYGSAGDAYHPTAPHPEGRGLQEAIHRAAIDAEITLADIRFINAHGTGTQANDAAELTALARLGFADRSDCPVVSTKGATGHTLGAAGGIEAVLTLCTLNAEATSGTTGCMNQDPNLPLMVLTAKESRNLTGRIGMSESLAFGGGNSALILEGNES
jgi:3-oxoacyl-[acyl-carrier-protein] synthase-1/3-oxoacyl-[acyl-carrier-protein] synthase II